MHQYESGAFFVKSAITNMAMMQNFDPTSDKCNVYRSKMEVLFHIFYFIQQHNCNAINAFLDVTTGANKTVVVSKQTKGFSLQQRHSK
jgi:hypothetical protein